MKQRQWGHRVVSFYWVFFGLWFCLGAGWIPPARAQGFSTQSLSSEPYQRDLIDSALRKTSLEVDAAPEGKVIGDYRYVINDVITEGDPWPLWFNKFHAITQNEVIAREILIPVGGMWDTSLIDESARNLRSYLLLAMAQIIPCKGPSGQVTALVVTKDLWSLRTNWDLTVVGSTIENLDVELTEANIAGRMKQAAISGHLDPATYEFGETFIDPRVSGSRVRLAEQASIILNRGTGTTEGGTGVITFGQPLYSLDTQWAWNVRASGQYEFVRLFSSGFLTGVQASTGEILPYVYRKRRWDAEASVTRSYGRDWKKNLSAGWRLVNKDHEFPDFGTSPSAQAVAEVSDRILPFSERYGEVFVGFLLAESRFIPLFDYNTFAITEDFQLGPSLSTELRWASPAFGYSSKFIEAAASIGWSEFLGPHLVSASIEGLSRIQSGVVTGTEWIRRVLTATATYRSPRFSFFRVHAGARVSRRDQNIDRSVDAIGGNNVLRGYPARYLVGSQSWSANLELRTNPLSLWNIFVGAAAFVDTAAVGEQFGSMTQHSSAGVGLRGVAPQFNVRVVRLDVAFPFESVGGLGASYVTLSLGQVF